MFTITFLRSEGVLDRDVEPGPTLSTSALRREDVLAITST
jgi:hypothetical protein